VRTVVKIDNNNSINNSKSLSFGEQAYTMPAYTYDTRYKQSLQQPQLPDIYNIDDSDKPSFKESFVEGPAGMMFKPWIEHPIATLGTFIGLGFGMDWFAKNCGGEYEKSIVGRVANFGDKIQNSSFCQSKPMKKTGNFLSNTTNKIKKILGKSDVLKAANGMSVQAESPMAKGLLYTTEDEIVQEFCHHIVAGKEGLGLEREVFDKATKLKNLYIDKNTEKFIKEVYGKSYKEIKNTAEAEKVANHIILKRLGLGEAEIKNIINGENATTITKNKVLEIMGKGLNEPLTPELLKKIEANPKEYRDVVRKIAENTKGKVWCAAGDYEWMGPIKRFFKRKISMDGIYNKFKSVATDSGHTSTGRFLSKAVQTMYRGLTFGQGKLGAFIFIAPMLVEMAINTKKADKDKKVGTGAWGFINAISWPISFMLGGKLMYGAASMKNAGISKEKLNKIDDIINKFNLKNEKHEFASFKEYLNARKACKKEIKALRKTPDMSLFDKIIKKVSGILSFDLKKFNGYRTNSKFTTALNKIPVGLRGKSGLVLKFALFMFAIQPLIDGILHKGCNLIFGKDYDVSIEDEQKAAKKAQKQYTKDDLHKKLLEKQALKQNLNTAEINQQATNMKQQTNALHFAGDDDISKKQVVKQDLQQEHLGIQQEDPIQNIQQVNIRKNDKLINTNTDLFQTADNKEQKGVITDNYSYIPAQDNKCKNTVTERKTDNYTYVPSSDNIIATPKNNDGNKYIPAQTAEKFNKTFDNSGLNDALKRADKAEQQALKILAGDFE